MARIVVKSQAELDALPERFDQYTVIEIRAAKGTWVSITQARENSSVVAWGNSSVEAWGNSSVVARGNSVCRIFCRSAKVELHGSSVGFLQVEGAIALRKSGYATIIQPPPPEWSVPGWLEREGVIEADGAVILYKRVSADYRTQEGQPWETKWPIGETLTHPAWDPAVEECNGGKFHACSRPYFADEFRLTKGDRYIAIQIRVSDLYAWPERPQYLHKIAFREGTVLYECDKHGRRKS